MNKNGIQEMIIDNMKDRTKITFNAIKKTCKELGMTELKIAELKKGLYLPWGNKHNFCFAEDYIEDAAMEIEKILQE